MGIERVIDTSIHEDDLEEKAVEFSLRPTTFDEYIGQTRLKTNLKLAIDAAKKRGDVLDHVLLF
ncbi:MAG: Holliday junction branch migration DNA helicase RuvB, partial [Candidatus Saccharibacteria bacterium]|nr:Holliday junction branch migration DNA helicase RuvB [Candidatus Saccharibacteria bacterium]